MHEKHKISLDEARRARSMLKIGIAATASIVLAHPFVSAESATDNRASVHKMVEGYLFSNTIEDTVSSVVSTLLDDAVRIVCDVSDLPGRTEAQKRLIQGSVQPLDIYGNLFAPDVMSLAPEQCNELSSLTSTKQLTDQNTQALFIASHEYEHIVDIDTTNEAKTNCRAMAKYPGYLMHLGISQPSALEIARHVAHRELSRQDPASPYIDEVNCRPGGIYTIDLEASSTTPLVYLNSATLS